jgi:putative transposase
MKHNLSHRQCAGAVIIAIRVDTDGRRDIVSMKIGTSEAEPIWAEFPRKLTRRSLGGVKARGLRCP